MNLLLGAKEKVGQEWVYILKDGTRMKKEEWTGYVEAYIRENDHQDIFEKMKQRLGSKRWFDQDTPHDFALQNYAAIHCTNVNVSHEVKVKPNKAISVGAVKDEFGCDQLMLV